MDGEIKRVSPDQVRVKEQRIALVTVLVVRHGHELVRRQKGQAALFKIIITLPVFYLSIKTAFKRDLIKVKRKIPTSIRQPDLYIGIIDQSDQRM